MWRCGDEYCCGDDSATNCCNDTNATMIRIEVGFNFHHPPQETTTSSSGTATSESASITTASGTPSSPTTEPSGTQETSAQLSAGGGGSASDNRGMAIGLGVGIPAALGVIASVCFLGMQIRKRNQGTGITPETQMQWQPEAGYKPFEQAGMTSSNGIQQPYQPSPAELESTRKPSELDSRS